MKFEITKQFEAFAESTPILLLNENVPMYYQANLLFSNITFKSKPQISINCIIEFLMFSFHLYRKNEVHVHTCSLSEAGIILSSPNPS